MFKKNSKNRRGMITVEAAMAIGLLMMPVAFICVSIPKWAEYKQFATVATREAARDAAARGTNDNVDEVIAQVSMNYGIPLSDVTFSSTPVVRGGDVSVSLTVRTPVFFIPVFNFSAASYDVDKTHHEPVDPYRSFTTP